MNQTQSTASNPAEEASASTNAVSASAESEHLSAEEIKQLREKLAVEENAAIRSAIERILARAIGHTGAPSEPEQNETATEAEAEPPLPTPDEAADAASPDTAAESDGSASDAVAPLTVLAAEESTDTIVAEEPPMSDPAALAGEEPAAAETPNAELSAAAPSDVDASAAEDTAPAEESTPADERASADKSAPAATAAPKKKKRIRWPWIVLACVLFVVVGYVTVAFVPSGPIAGLRNLYIQTAMSTADHQWLATMLFPKSVIDKAWVDPATQPQETPDDDFLDLLETAAPDNTPDAPPTDDPAGNTPTNPGNPTTPSDKTDSPVHIPPAGTDVLGLNKLRVGSKDYAGNKVVVVNKEEGLFISEFSGKSSLIPGMKYHGYVMLIDDPSRVFIGSTPEKDTTGYRILQMMNHYGDVVAGINASSFSDPNDEGTGADIIGGCISEGQFWGRYTTTMASVVLTKEHRLVVGWLPNWTSYTNIRDGMQFGPVLVYKGKNQIDKATGGGMGVQPRTAIGQREDGAIIMIVIDGRVASSIGCTMWEMADMMVKYGAVTAGGCDGGSSVVMAYDGKILNKNSSANPTYGRRIPNAFLVRSKKASK